MNEGFDRPPLSTTLDCNRTRCTASALGRETIVPLGTRRLAPITSRHNVVAVDYGSRVDVRLITGLTAAQNHAPATKRGER